MWRKGASENQGLMISTWYDDDDAYDDDDVTDDQNCVCVGSAMEVLA